MSKTELENIWIILETLLEEAKETANELEIQQIRFNTLIELVQKNHPEFIPNFSKVSNDRVRVFLKEHPSVQSAFCDNSDLLD